MSEQFKPGDLVECIRADALPFGEIATVLGALYTVTEALAHPDFGGALCCQVSEIDSHGWLWLQADFRLYRSPNIEALLRDCSDPVYGDNSRDGAAPKKRERA